MASLCVDKIKRQFLRKTCGKSWKLLPPFAARLIEAPEGAATRRRRRRFPIKFCISHASIFNGSGAGMDPAGALGALGGLPRCHGVIGRSPTQSMIRSARRCGCQKLVERDSDSDSPVRNRNDGGEFKDPTLIPPKNEEQCNLRNIFPFFFGFKKTHTEAIRRC